MAWQFFLNSSASNIFKIHPVVVEVLHVDMKAVNLTDWQNNQPTNKQASNQLNQPTN
jgi:hypothetical protein